MTKLTQDERIIRWNEERLLIKDEKDLDMSNEMSYILEEVIEGLTEMDSLQARTYAKQLAKIISGGYLPHCMSILELEIESIPEQKTDLSKKSIENFVDALGDIKVFATGSIRKAGYNPDLVMNEVLQEIESRTGTVINGKYTKDTSPEAKSKWYKAQFDNAKVG